MYVCVCVCLCEWEWEGGGGAKPNEAAVKIGDGSAVSGGVAGEKPCNRTPATGCPHMPMATSSRGAWVADNKTLGAGRGKDRAAPAAPATAPPPATVLVSPGKANGGEVPAALGLGVDEACETGEDEAEEGVVVVVDVRVVATREVAAAATGDCGNDKDGGTRLVASEAENTCAVATKGGVRGNDVKVDTPTTAVAAWAAVAPG
jgi:hypothetical protein